MNMILDQQLVINYDEIFFNIFLHYLHK
jgi:hypothetical protein